MKAENRDMFLAMRNIFYGGEFSAWLEGKPMPWAAMKEWQEAEDYFCKQTGFIIPEPKHGGKE
jgi:hypothetical protein